MQWFLDSANIEEIKDLVSKGIISGVTTNPTLIAKEGKGMREQLIAIRSVFDGVLNAEVTQIKRAGMLTEIDMLEQLKLDLTIKLPGTIEGLQLAEELSDKQVATNITLIFNLAQAVMAAEAGATYISPFVGRLDDANRDGIGFVKELRAVFDRNHYTTKILAASLRTPQKVYDAIVAGANVVTVPYTVYEEIFNDPQLLDGLKKFEEDSKKFEF
jgi:transaldolase